MSDREIAHARSADVPSAPIRPAPDGPRNVSRRGRALADAVRWPSLLYRVYERKLVADLAGGELPHHVGVMLDGNRRWAREKGFTDPNEGHRAGAAHIDELLSWCTDSGIRLVTLWLLSTDNLRRPDGRAAAAAGHHRRRRRRPGRTGRAVEAAHRRRAGDAAAVDADAARRRRAADRRAHRRGGQHRGRLRRPAGDRRRGEVAAAQPVRPGPAVEEVVDAARRGHHRASISTPRASPIPIWSSGPPASSAVAGS